MDGSALQERERGRHVVSHGDQGGGGGIRVGGNSREEGRRWEGRRSGRRRRGRGGREGGRVGGGI